MGPRGGSGAGTSGRAPRRARFRLREDRADPRQSRLDAYAAAVTVSDAARARYDAALSAYTVPRRTCAAVAQVSRRTKPVATAKERAAPKRSSPTTRADDGGILGGIGGVIGGAATAAWDFGTSALVGAADLVLCAVPITGLGCSPATLASSLATDWDGCDHRKSPPKSGRFTVPPKAALVRLFCEDDGLEAEPFDKARDRLTPVVVVAMHNEDASLGCRLWLTNARDTSRSRPLLQSPSAESAPDLLF